MSALYCTRCAGNHVVLLRRSLDERYPIVHCSSCEADVPGTGNEALARSIVADRERESRERKHNRHLLDGREVASCGACVSAKLKRKYEQAATSS
jgi:hypothetical protein